MIVASRPPVLATAPLSLALVITKLPGASTVSRGAEIGMVIVKMEEANSLELEDWANRVTA